MGDGGRSRGRVGNSSPALCQMMRDTLLFATTGDTIWFITDIIIITYQIGHNGSEHDANPKG